jgi:hypothetical protein
MGSETDEKGTQWDLMDQIGEPNRTLIGNRGMSVHVSAQKEGSEGASIY